MNLFDEFATGQDNVNLDSIVLDTSSSVGIKVPNKFPTLINYPYKIAVIGEAPGKDEEEQGEPFVGMSGKLLTGMLAKAGIVRDACFVGNVCQYRPPANNIDFFSREGTEISEGLEALRVDLTKFNPNICLLLGKTALWAFSGLDTIGNYRGSLGIGNESLPYKYISSYHPAACLRQYSWTAYLWFDILKCLSEATDPALVIPQRELTINQTFEELIYALTKANEATELRVSVDIEGGIGSLSCCSIANSGVNSFIVPFCNLDASSYWSEEQEIEVWRAFIRIMTNPKVLKVFQNGLYDRFVLAYSYAITVRGCIDDTMLKWAEWLCEIEKGLGVQSSILTKEPYYKFERKSTTREEFYRYCCKDSAITHEINEKLNLKLDPAQRRHYEFNVALLNPILYMELRGIKYDYNLAQKRLEEVNRHVYTLQARLDAIAGVGITKTSNRDDVQKAVKEAMCYKRDGVTPKKEFEEDYPLVLEALGSAELTDEQIGFINTACKWSMNIKSDRFKTFLYSTLKLPIQYDPKTKQPTTDYEALLKLSKKSDHEAIRLALEIGELRTRSQMLEIHADEDGRIRCGYNIVGTETGRITCYTSPTGSGYNLQTIPDENHLKPVGHPLRGGLRSLFVADPGCYLFQCDLKGSDGWTIGAHLASLGDPTMLDDLRFDLKPAAVVCYMLRHGNSSLSGKKRDEVKELLKEVHKEDWDYFACKCGIWGTCYTMGPRKLSDLILVQSEGRVFMDEAKTRSFQQAVFGRYNVHLWHRAMERQLKQRKELVSPNGHRRRFFGRSTEILGQALAHEPQVNTTYATNLAAYKLWTDPENRSGSLLRCVLPDRVSHQSNQNTKQVALRTEPLHQVHDALIGQFKITDTD